MFRKRRFVNIAVLIERYVIRPSRIQPTLYGVYDLLEEHFVVPYVEGKNSEDSYNRAWLIKDKIDYKEDRQKNIENLSHFIYKRGEKV